jgi:hypothetical protein
VVVVINIVLMYDEYECNDLSGKRFEEEERRRILVPVGRGLRRPT